MTRKGMITFSSFISVTSYEMTDCWNPRSWSEQFSSIWRMYPKSTGGFTIRPVDVSQTEDVAKDPECKYLAPQGTDVRDKALSLQLVRPEHGGEDEYYFQNLDDGKYVAVQYSKESIDYHYRLHPHFYLLDFEPLPWSPDDVPS